MRSLHSLFCINSYIFSKAGACTGLSIMLHDAFVYNPFDVNYIFPPLKSLNHCSQFIPLKLLDFWGEGGGPMVVFRGEASIYYLAIFFSPNLFFSYSVHPVPQMDSDVLPAPRADSDAPPPLHLRQTQNFYPE